MAPSCLSGIVSAFQVLILSTLLTLVSTAIPTRAAPAPAPSSAIVSSWAQLAALPEKDAARGIPCRVRAVVVCYDKAWGQLYLHDGRSVMYFSPATFPENPEPGVQVEIEGSTQFDGHGAGIKGPTMRIIGPSAFPPALRLPLPDLTNSIGQWVEVAGRIRGVDTSRGRLGLTLHHAGVSCLVYVMRPLPPFDARQFLGREALVRGINASKLEKGRLASASLIAPGTNEIRLFSTPIDFTALSALSIDALLDRELGEWTNQPVRLAGVVAAYRPGEYVVLRDPTGTIRARVTQVSTARMGERISLWGYMTMLPNEAILDDAFFEPVEKQSPPSSATGGTNFVGLPINLPLPLTRISDVFSIPRDQLARRFPVLLHGTVTFADPAYRNAFLQQDDAAVYFDLTQGDVRAGQKVEVRGVTDPGGFAPQINDATTIILGAAEFPPALRVTLDDLAGGTLDSHFVELEGVVRRAEIEWDHLRLLVSTSQGRFHAIVPGVTNAASAAQHWVGARVAVLGACASMVNARGQVSGITLHVPSLDHVRVLRAAPADPFAGTATPIATVATLEAPRVGHGRLKIAGTVTVQVPRASIYIQDMSGGIRLSTQETDVFKVGDRVEAVGFPALGDFSPCLEEVLLRRISPGPSAEPFKTSAGDILNSGRSDGRLVGLQAQLIQRVSRSAQPRLVLQDGSIIFTAHLVGQTSDERLHQLEVGSLLNLVGVCAVQGDQSREPDSFRLLIGDSAAVDVLQRPSWWSVRRALGAAGVSVLAVLLALAWVGSLRRRVHAQTRVIRRQLEEGKAFAASLDHERNLLATLIDQLPDHVFVMDAAGRVLLTNRSYEEFRHGPTRDTVSRENHPTRPETPDSPESAMDDEDHRVLTEGTSVIDAERSLPDSNGTPHWLSVSKVPLRAGTGSIAGLVAIRHDVTERKRTEAELLEIHKQLVTASHRAGMAEVATSVLHNVGNVLNSINVSVKCLTEQTRQSKVNQITQLADLLAGANTGLADFLRQDPRGTKIPEYLRQLAELMAAERQSALQELGSLSRHVDHIKAIVARQQGHARTAGVTEEVSVPELIDDAVHLCSHGPQGPRVPVSRHYPATGLPTISLDRHKAIQILVNLVNNAIQACEGSQQATPAITVAVTADADLKRLCIVVRDNGRGIAPEHLPMLFRYGFTTRRSGHGFGLHNAALAAKALGGALHAFSDGTGRGAAFTLELPLQSHASNLSEKPRPEAGHRTVLASA
ncbi:MAG: PAS domain-containing protein [Verrucomicrobiales bacterium]|nr:PAS domain-containing protein [Verrucomicrobiales bacterium]